MIRTMLGPLLGHSIDHEPTNQERQSDCRDSKESEILLRTNKRLSSKCYRPNIENQNTRTLTTGPANTVTNVLVLNHVLYLLLHCKAKQYDEVQQKDGPEHRDVENGEKSHHKGYQERPRR